MTALTHDEVVELARQYFEVYISLVHDTDMPQVTDGKAVPAAHHQRIIELLVHGERNALIVTPRDSGKTTLVQAWLEWRIGRESLKGGDWANKLRVLYITASAYQAHRVSVAVKAVIEGSEAYRAVFPGVLPNPDKWSEGEWRVVGNTIKDPTFQAAGIEGGILGSRAEVIVLDDVLSGTESSGERDDVCNQISGRVMPILVPWGRAVHTTTRWAWNDTAAWAMARGWETLYLKAVEEEGGKEKSYWPERYPMSKLRQLRKDDPRHFARQYQNEVVPDEGLHFRREWFDGRRFDSPPQEVLFRVDSWDTASGEGKNRSFSVGLSALVTPDFHIYLVNMARGQVPYGYLKDMVREVSRRHRSDYIIVEYKQVGMALSQELRAEGLSIVDWFPAGERGRPTVEQRNTFVSTFCEEGRVHLPTDYFCRKLGSEPWLDHFEKELYGYEGKKITGQTDDCVDALCQLIYWVQIQGQRYRRLHAQPRLLTWGESRSGKVLV